MSLQSMQKRTMAGFLFEFAMPGMRRNPGRVGTNMDPINASTKYKLLGKLFNRYQKFYQAPEFQDYLHEFHGQPYFYTKKGDLYHSTTFPNQELVTPDEIPFKDLMPEFSRSHHLYDWMHSGNVTWRIGNHRRRQAAHLWILSDDPTRRLCLTNIEDTGTTLNHLTQKAYGQDYVMRVPKRIKRLQWLCQEAVKEPKIRANKVRPKIDPNLLNFTLRPPDAEYLAELYDLQLVKPPKLGKPPKRKF